MWIETSKQLPPEGKYVLARHNRGTWCDFDDPKNVNCVIVKLRKGISQEERRKMESGELPNPLHAGMRRSTFITGYDEYGNNQVPYGFSSFGSDQFFGQEITHWQPIEDLI